MTTHSLGFYASTPQLQSFQGCAQRSFQAPVPSLEIAIALRRNINFYILFETLAPLIAAQDAYPLLTLKVISLSSDVVKCSTRVGKMINTLIVFLLLGIPRSRTVIHSKSLKCYFQTIPQPRYYNTTACPPESCTPIQQCPAPSTPTASRTTGNPTAASKPGTTTSCNPTSTPQAITSSTTPATRAYNLYAQELPAA